MKHVLEEMWAALAVYQKQADKNGHGKSWAKMCREKTSSAAYAAYSDASTAAAADAAVYAAGAVYADAEDAEDAAEWAQKAIDRINLLIKPPQRKADHGIKE